jgi:hypothetical protein
VITAVRALAALAFLATACDREIVVGADPDAASAAGVRPLVVPWSTGFENGLGDWDVPCYAAGGGTYQIVTSPVHSGQHAAAFTVNTAVSGQPEARCVKRGVLPQSAYYGAWYYVPALATNRGNWNLFHFRGGNTGDVNSHGLWDVSLVNDADGGLDNSVFQFLTAPQRVIATKPTIRINEWFHLEVLLRRANGATGQFTLYRDGQVVLELTGIATDDSQWGEWHVGNLATALSPAVSTVYVDDVTIDTSGP